MLQGALATLTAVTFIWLLWIIFRHFVLGNQWFVADLYVIVIAASIPLTVLIKIWPQSEEISAHAVLGFLVYALFAETPVIIGAWCGLTWAKRLNEVRTVRRMLLILAGIMVIPGALLAIYLPFTTFASGLDFLGPHFDHSKMLLRLGEAWIGLLVFLLPATLIELRCRKVENLARSERLLNSRKPKQSADKIAE